LKPEVGPAWTEIVPAQFFNQEFGTVNDADAALDARFRREPLSTLTGAFEKRSPYNGICLP